MTSGRKTEADIENRDLWLAHTLVTLTDTGATDFDIDRFLADLAERYTELVDDAEVCITLDGVATSTSERVQAFQEFCLLKNEGPGVESSRTDQPVVNVAADERQRSWPALAALTRAAGIGAVHAIPMHHHGDLLGTVNLYCPDDRMLTVEEIGVAQAIADSASIGITQARQLQSCRSRNGQLQEALDSRVVIEQAKGVLSERLTVPMESAFALMRQHARRHNRRLHSVAVAVVEGSAELQLAS